MNIFSYQESDPDEDGDVTTTLTIISQDSILLRRARKAFRVIVDDTVPNLSVLPSDDPRASG